MRYLPAIVSFRGHTYMMLDRGSEKLLGCRNVCAVGPALIAHKNSQIALISKHSIGRRYVSIVMVWHSCRTELTWTPIPGTTMFQCLSL